MPMTFGNFLIQTDPFAVCTTPAKDHAILNKHRYKQQMTTKEQGILHRVIPLFRVL